MNLFLNIKNIQIIDLKNIIIQIKILAMIFLDIIILCIVLHLNMRRIIKFLNLSVILTDKFSFKL